MRTCVKRSHTDILKEGGERETRDRVRCGERERERARQPRTMWRERKTPAYNVEREKDNCVQCG